MEKENINQTNNETQENVSVENETEINSKKQNFIEYFKNHPQSKWIIAIAIIIIFLIIAIFVWWTSKSNLVWNPMWVLNKYKSNMQQIVLINSNLLKENTDISCQALKTIEKNQKLTKEWCKDMKNKANKIITKLWKAVENKIENINEKIKECNKKYIIDKNECLNNIIKDIADLNLRLIENSNDAINSELRWYNNY